MTELLGASITNLKKLLYKKKISQEELYHYFLKRIKKYNPSLNAYLSTVSGFEHSQDGLLAGIPLSIKDNFCTKGIRTTASSKVLDNFIPPYDATVIERLKNQGAHIIGKTNMDAWAHGSSTETSDYGPTKNPWDIERAPGGSSGGSAATVAAYLAPASIGSETAGSIRQPAAWCGVVGLKPTYGRVSRYGVIAMGSSLDCPGPISLTVEDSALILSAIAGKDQYDATSSPHHHEPYHELIREKKTLRIGIPEEYFEGNDPDVKESVMKAVKICEKMGHPVKPVRLIHPKYAISVYTVIQRAEVSSNLARYDGIRYGEGRFMFGQEAKKRIMLGAYTLSHGFYDAYYKQAQKIRALIIDDFKHIFHDVDVIISPTTPVAALKLGEFEKYPFFGEMMDVLNEPAAVAGIPAVNIPVGLDRNELPIGMQIMGNYFEEASVLNLAYQFEKETDFFGIIKKGLEKYE